MASLIASEDDLQQFQRLPVDERRLNHELKGVLAEIATTGRIRYTWSLLCPLVATQIRHVLTDYDASEKVEVGPAPPPPFGESLNETIDRLTRCLAEFSEAPFTIQRLCEVLLEPRKQYTKFEKVVVAIEKTLLVTSTVPVSTDLPPRPALTDIPPVNENPPKVEMKPPGNGKDPFTVRPGGEIPNSPYSGRQEMENRPLNNGISPVETGRIIQGSGGLVSSVLSVNSAPMEDMNGDV